MGRGQKIISTVSMVSPGFPAMAQRPDSGDYSEPEYETKVVLGNRVPMRDGVRLSVDLYRPDAPGRFPVVLTHTGYSNLGGTPG